jgi:hypothetical protein
MGAEASQDTTRETRRTKLPERHVDDTQRQEGQVLRPAEDTPKVLAEYAKAYKFGPGWQFLTGHPKDIELLRQKLGFIDRDPVRDADRSNHIGMLRWGNEPHTLWAGCPALLPPAKIVKEIGLVDWPAADEGALRKDARGGDR